MKIKITKDLTYEEFSEQVDKEFNTFKKWGWHWRYNDEGKPIRVGIWFWGTPINYKIYIPFINQLWIK